MGDCFLLTIVQDGKLMVLYDLEERISVAIGNLWYEKGIDNFVILTGTDRRNDCQDMY